MDSTGRLLKLLSLLQARPGWGGAELADRLGVTPRTLRRDMTRLRDLGYPVDAVPGPYGGYRLAAGGAVPPLLLDDDEAVTVALGLRAAATGGLVGFEDAAVAALAKIEQVLPARLRERIAELEAATVHLGSDVGRGAALSAELLVTVAASCRRPERLRFRYVDGQGRATERHVEPYQLVYSGRRWYLVARDRDREAWRTFRVDRMRDPIPTGIRVVHVDPPDSAALVAEGTAVAAYTHQAKVLLEAPLEVAAEYVSPTVAVLEPGRDGTILRVGADELDWIARYLARLPFRFEVIEPEGLRAALSAVADRLMAAARS